MLNNLLNVLLGIIASLIAWLILTKALRPRIILGDTIDQVIREDSSEYYRLTYKNPRIRRVEDVHVSARIFRSAPMGLGGRRVWNSTDIPVDEPFRPVLGRLPLATRMMRYIRRKRLIQHVTLELESLGSSRFLADLPEGCPSVVRLHEFLQKTDATIEFAVRAADGYSGVYRTVARTYKAQHVSVIDRRAQQVADGSHETRYTGANAPSLPVARGARRYLSAASMAMIFQVIKRVRLRLTAQARKRDKTSVIAIDADDGENGNEADHA